MTMESDDLAAPATNEAAISAASPESMSNEDLAGFVRDGIKQLKNLLPYVRELRQRFAELPRGHADILGCRTWNQFCIQVLDHQPRAIRKALEDKPARVKADQTLYWAVKRVLPLCDPEYPPLIRFTVLGKDHLTLRVYDLAHGGLIAEDTIDFSTTTANNLDHKGGIFNRGSCPKIDFVLNVDYFIDFLKKCNGNPIIFFISRWAMVHFITYPSPDLQVEQYVAPANFAPGTVPEEYPGEFLPPIKGAIILFPLENRQQSAEWLEKYQEAERVRQAALTESEARRQAKQAEQDRQGEEKRRIAQAEREEKERRLDAMRQRITEILPGVPPENQPRYGSAVSIDDYEHLTLTLRNLSFEQLERIVEVLKAAPAPVPETVQA